MLEKIPTTHPVVKNSNSAGHPLGPDGLPLSEHGVDPRAPRSAEIAGWIEPSAIERLDLPKALHSTTYPRSRATLRKTVSSVGSDRGR